MKARVSGIRTIAALSIVLCAACSRPEADGDGDAQQEEAALESARCDAAIDPRNDPNAIHADSSSTFFEGWYYRVLDPTNRESYIVIVAYGRAAGATNAFIQVSRSSDRKTWTTSIPGFDVNALQRKAGTFDAAVGGVRFTANSIKGSFVASNGERVDLDLAISGCRYWGAPSDPGSRVTMGFAVQAPGVNTRWDVHHLRSLADGTIVTNGARKTFTKAYVHQEKNWGNGFPSHWIWMQANQFNGKDAAFVASGGPIFGFGNSPEGYMAGLRYEGKFYDFKTQTGATFTTASYQNGHWQLEAFDALGQHRLVVDGFGSLDAAAAVPILVPSASGPTFGAAENLNGRLLITLYQRSGITSWSPIVNLESSSAALEAGGSLRNK